MRLKRKGCALDLREEYFVSEGTVERHSLSKFLGPDGLMRLLSFIAKEEFPVAEVLRMIKRLNIRGYETARHYFRRAVSEGIISPGTPEDYPEQKDIDAVLNWRRQKNARRNAAGKSVSEEYRRPCRAEPFMARNRR